ncbi:ABC transporter permease [Streptosporangium sp. NPDC049376]|uniref:ABC transporter permease n=1 Tax=Streptosporangium sp. NPDC049376 TaxID=3366192 RepID=UPI003792C69B
MTYAAVAVLALLVPPIVFDLVFRPAIRRIGLREVLRRPRAAALVVFGSMLATALITGSFVVGDSFGTSYRVRAETHLGPLDLLVTSENVKDDLRTLDASRLVDRSPIESVMAVREGEITATDGHGRTRPRTRFWELEPAEARAFGDDLDASGLTRLPARLGRDEVAINTRLARSLDLTPGDDLELTAGPTTVKLRVARVLRERGIAGYAPIIVTKGTLSDALPHRPGVVRDMIAVSNVGGTYGGADRTVEAELWIVAALGDRTPVVSVKSPALDRANRIGDEAKNRFGMAGGFPFAAAVLLVISLFVMFVTERRAELGTLRAIGLRRGHIRRIFAVKGLVLGLPATLLGLGAGVCVAALVVRVSHGSFGVDENLRLHLDVQPAALLSGALIGLAVSQLTVLAATLRTTGADIMAAMQDAAPHGSGGSRRWIVLGLSLSCVAAAGWLLTSDRQFTAFAAPIVFVLGFLPLLIDRMGRKVAVTLCCGLALVWASTVFGILTGTFEEVDLKLLIVRGVVLVGLSSVVVAVFDGWLVAPILAVTRRFVAPRLGLTTVLARPVRTALLTSLYALVAFALTFTAILNTVLRQEEPNDVARAGGGYDVVLFSSRLSPVTTKQLRARSDVASAIRLTDGYAMITSAALDRYEAAQGHRHAWDSGTPRPLRRTVTLVTPELAGNRPPRLAERSQEFGSDAEVWAHVAADASAVIVPKYVGLEVGDSVRLVDRSNRPTELKVVGLSDWNRLVGAGLYVSEKQAGSLLTEVPPLRRQYVAAAPGTTADALVEALNTDYVTAGADAHSFAADVAAESAKTGAFVQTLRGSIGLGLLVGMAGLAVVLVRGVRERRGQFAMLRTIGFRPGALRNALLVEVSFVGVQGTVLGAGLGVLSVWQVLAPRTATARGLGFTDLTDLTVPVAFLVVLALSALAAALLAVRAGRAVSAEALRPSHSGLLI